MGVTLERVQNKFACIIGELCSEPDVLSEFAIWLDLRLAEYKAKGAISLECSGETPDPTWLRGHKKPPKRIKTPQMNADIHYDSAQRYSEDISQELSERLSPDIVVVKEEPSDDTDVYPINIYSHDNSSSNVNISRKRVSNDSKSVEDLDKRQRLLSPSSVLEPVNQSLMSIISEGTEDDSTNMTANLSSSFSNMDSSQIDTSSFIPSSHPVASTSRQDPMDQQDGSNSGSFNPGELLPSYEVSNAGRRGTYLNWSPLLMEKAVAAVLDRQMSRSKASEVFGVPNRTLCRKIQKIKELEEKGEMSN